MVNPDLELRVRREGRGGDVALLALSTVLPSEVFFFTQNTKISRGGGRGAPPGHLP